MPEPASALTRCPSIQGKSRPTNNLMRGSASSGLSPRQQFFHKWQESGNDPPHAVRIGMHVIRLIEAGDRRHALQKERIVEHARPFSEVVEHGVECILVV